MNTSGAMSPDAHAFLADPHIAAQYDAGALVLSVRGAAPRLVFASAAAAAAFDAGTLAVLARIVLSADQPGGRRLLRLARTLEPGRAARLERLRFFVGGRSEIFEFECRKLDTPAIDRLLVAVARPRRSPVRRDRHADLFDAAADAQTSAPGRPDTDGDAAIVGRRIVRFVWETDEDHLATRVLGFAPLVGLENDLVVGTSLPDRAQGLGADPDKKLSSALERHETFSALELHWPTSHGPTAVTFAAQPKFDARRQFLGYRGFGMLRVDRHARESELPDNAAEYIAPSAVAAAPEVVDAATLEAEPLPTVPTAASAREASLPAMGVIPVDDPATAPDLTQIDDAGVIDGSCGWSGESMPTANRRTLDTMGAASGEMRAVKHPATTDGGDARADADIPASHDERPPERPALSVSETDAFDELASLLQARLADEQSPATADVAPGQPSPEPAVSTRPPSAPAQELPPSQRNVDGGLAAAMERLPIGVLVSRDGVALYINRTLLDMLGHADLAAFTRAGGLDRTLRGRDPDSVGEPGTNAIALNTAAGDVLDVDGHLQAINWAGAAATLMSFRRSSEPEIARRVGELHGELTSLESEAAELHAILDTATDGVAVLDKSGVVLSLNRSAEALFGVEQGDVIGEPFTCLFAAESHATARDYLDGLKKSGVASVLNDGREVVGRAGRRGIIPLFMTLGRLPQRDVPRFCAVLRDLTPWKRAERDLQEARRTAERASQMKSDFLARVSHEIRTPMNAILGFAEVIVEERFGALGNDRYKGYLRDIHASGLHVMNIVNDLLDLSKIEAGKMELNFASVDANKVVADCVGLMQPQADRERVIIRVALAPRLPNIVADERSLRQMVLNILSNAVNFNAAGGQVIVSSALTDSGAAVLRIRDTGVGMSENELEAALEPFRQLPTARKGGGTGLGLPLTRAMADANRASFTIKSKKNEGTLVEIAFPSARVLTG